MNYKEVAPLSLRMYSFLFSNFAMGAWFAILVVLVFIATDGVQHIYYAELSDIGKALLLSVMCSMFVLIWAVSILFAPHLLSKYHYRIISASLRRDLDERYVFKLNSCSEGYHFYLAEKNVVKKVKCQMSIEPGGESEAIEELETYAVFNDVFNVVLKSDNNFLNSDQLDLLKEVATREIANYESSKAASTEKLSG